MSWWLGRLVGIVFNVKFCINMVFVTLVILLFRSHYSDWNDHFILWIALSWIGRGILYLPWSVIILSASVIFEVYGGRKQREGKGRDHNILMFCILHLSLLVSGWELFFPIATIVKHLFNFIDYDLFLISRCIPWYNK